MHPNIRTAITAERPIVSDSFDRANSATSLGSADSGQVWVATNGTWGITSGKALLVTDSGDNFAIVNTGAADFSLSVDWYNADGSFGGVVFKAVDGDNMYYFIGNGSFMEVKRRTAGAETHIAGEADGNAPVDVERRYSVVVSGAKAFIYRANILIHAITMDQHLSGTFVGFRDPIGGAKFDNLRVTR